MKPLNIPHGEGWHFYDPKSGDELTHSTTILYGLRHGTTDMNEQGLHRGWEDVPLDDDGREDASEAALTLDGRGIKAIYSSDLGRAKETARIVAKKLKLKVIVDFRLRPWNKGDFQGEPKDETKEAFDYYVNHPDKKVPGGESLDSFNKRYEEALDEYIKQGKDDGPILLVSHNSNMIGTVHYLNDDKGKEADKEVVQPGGIFELCDNVGDLEFEIIFKKGDSGPSGS
jgi:broad specificity phosphatase PhoE